jgi:hypothetical protein
VWIDPLASEKPAIATPAHRALGVGDQRLRRWLGREHQPGHEGQPDPKRRHHAERKPSGNFLSH